MTMRYLATGCFQRVTVNFASPHKEYIKFPQTEVDIQTTKQKFYVYCQFSRIIGSIDYACSCSDPGDDFAEIYRNRNGCHSSNVRVTFFPLPSNLFSRGLQVWMKVNGYTFNL